MKERRGKCMYYYVVGVQEVVVIVAVFAVSFRAACVVLCAMVLCCLLLSLCLSVVVLVVVSLTPPFMTLGIDKGCVPIHYVQCQESIAAHHKKI